MSNVVMPTQRRIHNFLIEFGVKEDEPLDIVLGDDQDAMSNPVDIMIGLGYFWSEKYQRYILKDSILYEENEREIVEYLQQLNQKK